MYIRYDLDIIHWAIIRSIGFMSNRVTIMLWTIIHNTLRTDSVSFSNKITMTSTTTLSCQMFKSVIFCVASISKNGEDNPSRQFYCFALYESYTIRENAIAVESTLSKN